MKIISILYCGLVCSLATVMISKAEPVITHGMRIDPQAAGAGVKDYLSSSAATLGNTSVLVWTRIVNGDVTGNFTVGLQLAGVNGDGSLHNQIELARFQVRGLNYPHVSCSVCPAGDGFLVTYRDLTGLHGQFLNRDGVPVAGATLTEADAAVIHYFQLASTGTPTGSAVLWLSSTGGLRCSLTGFAGNSEVRTVEVAAAGTDYIISLTLAVNGPDVLAAWSLSNGKTYYRLIRPDGTMPFPAVEAGTLTDSYNDLAVSASGDGYALSMVENDPAVLYEGRIYRLLLVDKNGTATPLLSDPFLAPSNLHACAFSPLQPDGGVLAVRVNPQRWDQDYVESNLWTVRRIAPDGSIGNPVAGPAANFLMSGAFRIVRAPGLRGRRI